MSGRRRQAGQQGALRRGRAIQPVSKAEAAAGGVGTGGGSSALVDLTTGVTGDLPFANLAQIAGLSVLGVTGAATADVAAITAGSDKQVLRRSGSGLSFGAIDISSSSAVTGDLALANLAQGGALSVLGVAGNATADYADISAASDGQVLRRSGTSIGFGAVSLSTAAAVTGKLPLANIVAGTALSVLGVTGNAGADYADIAAGSDGQVLRRSGTAVAFGAVSLSTAAAVTGQLPWANLANVSATSRILGRTTAGAGVIEELTLTQALDLVGSAAQGDILFRGSASWKRLATGTSGQLLQSQGAAADLQWASITGATVGVGAFFTGTGNPQGVLAAAIGAEYIDTANGYLYRKIGGGSTSYGWYYQPPIGAGLINGPLPFNAYPSAISADASAAVRMSSFGAWGSAISGDAADALRSTGNQGNSVRTLKSGKTFAEWLTAATTANSTYLAQDVGGGTKWCDDDWDCTLLMLTGSDITNIRFWFGVATAVISDTDTIGTTNGAIMFRYSTPAGDGGWVGYNSDAGGGTAVTTTVASIAASTVYKLRIRLVRATPAVFYSVDDGAEIQATTRITPTGKNSFIQFGITTKANVAKHFAWRAVGAMIGS